MNSIPNQLLIDDFLPLDVRDRLLDFALANVEAFVPSKIQLDKEGTRRADWRSSWDCEQKLGSLETAFTDAILDRQGEMFSALGFSPFEISSLETSLVCYRDGGFYVPHVDTATGKERDGFPSDRVLSAVYYFHSQPRRFNGGELALFPLGPGEPCLVEPADNRLIVFPSFLVHEVRPVQCEDDDFAHARFSINCWLRRAKSTG